MPVMDGFEFLEHLRANAAWRDIPVVVITAKTLEPKEVEALRGVTQRIIEKGASTGVDLRTAIRDVLRPHVSA
jgi:CheY-like chemotaxis protein